MDHGTSHHLVPGLTLKRELNECSDDNFAPLSRVEDGLMCIYGAGFSSTEGLYDHLSKNPQPKQPVRKAIRFSRLHGRRVDWPLHFYDVKPDTKIIPEGDTRFEGQHCRPWTKRQRALYEGTYPQVAKNNEEALFQVRVDATIPYHNNSRAEPHRP